MPPVNEGYDISSEQQNPSGRIRHLLSLEALPRSFLLEVLDRAERFAERMEAGEKNSPISRAGP